MGWMSADFLPSSSIFTSATLSKSLRTNLIGLGAGGALVQSQPIHDSLGATLFLWHDLKQPVAWEPAEPPPRGSWWVELPGSRQAPLALGDGAALQFPAPGRLRNCYCLQWVESGHQRFSGGNGWKADFE